MYKIELTPAEVSHLLTLLRDKQQEGGYYGNKAQYYAKTDAITKKLQDEVSRRSDG